jgi:hypothetical protein
MRTNEGVVEGGDDLRSCPARMRHYLGMPTFSTQVAGKLLSQTQNFWWTWIRGCWVRVEGADAVREFCNLGRQMDGELVVGLTPQPTNQQKNKVRSVSANLTVDAAKKSA